MKQKTSFRNILQNGQLNTIVGAYNGLSARLVEEAGFSGIWASGFAISASHAVPDANILTMTDLLRVAGEMVNVVSIPVVADCDSGFGNANNVMHMVRKLEGIGISAVCIEDKKFPKVNSFVPGRQELAPLAEFAGKIMAAKSAQVTEEFMVFARVEALIAGWGQAEALKRAEAYRKAGADGIFIHSKANSAGEIIEFCRRWERRSPLLICPTTYDIDEKEMRELGVNVVIYANQAIRGAVKSVRDILRCIREKKTRELELSMVSMEQVFQLQGMHLMKSNEKKYLKSDMGSLKAIIPAAGAKVDKTLASFLNDRPLGMLDINGKSLLQRNIETLNIAGVQDINVVVGYKGEEVKVEGAEIIRNPQFRTKDIMHSIFKGINSIADKNIILYSDIILDRYFLQKLMKKEEDIILAVDSTYKKTHSRNKKLELVAAQYPPLEHHRSMEANRENPICMVGKHLSENEAHFEFVGAALLSKKGMEILIKEYENAEIPEPVSFISFIQYLIEKGYKVVAHEVNSGWMELHNLNDYKKACSIFS